MHDIFLFFACCVINPTRKSYTIPCMQRIISRNCSVYVITRNMNERVCSCVCACVFVCMHPVKLLIWLEIEFFLILPLALYIHFRQREKKKTTNLCRIRMWNEWANAFAGLAPRSFDHSNCVAAARRLNCIRCGMKTMDTMFWKFYDERKI